jgi:hypothetical protein
MMDWLVKNDGRVGPWHEWVVTMTAMTVLAGYLFRSFLSIMGHIAHGHATIYVLDPHSLLLLIPVGILLGEIAYETDYEMNGPKAIDTEDNHAEKTLPSG